eukprot:CAMPEP_0197196422 /NCGR_PEP_ID=MMETSP1423-20130617/32349_1 /TAXON_ID=476441 /ORGANISM="Pseudo-nitzschia heimii, Strain UNC1101" /LENGTH=505 /DNA_ID=CAMNT_0042650221 /DNA_START=146 /DNA_END=1663 /DNA_ORIENTATION=-
MLAVGRKAQPSAGFRNTDPSSKSSSSSSSCRLSFYEAPPAVDVDVDTFETYGIARLQVLRRIDVLQARGVKGDRFDKEILKADLEHLFPAGSSSSSDENKDNKDRISHYVLRMAYCQTEELRRWFLTNECLLFKLRFETAKPSDVDRFLRDQDTLLRHPPISQEEKMRLKPKLLGVNQPQVNNGNGNGNGILRHPPISQEEKMRLKPKLLGVNQPQVNNGNGNGNGNGSGVNAAETAFNKTEYYRVPFADVLSLVARREVYLEAGHAYVSRSRILSIVEGRFRTSLSGSLARAYQMQHVWSSDVRIGSVVSRLSKVAFRYGGGGAGGLAGGGSADTAHATTQVFLDYLRTVMGHSDLKTKPAGVNKLFVSTGTRKPNVADRTCPIAGRIHKSNTQKYTVYFDTLVMEQGCWDGCCQATNKHVYYAIKTTTTTSGDGGDGSTSLRCARVGWNPPPLDPNALRSTLEAMGCRSGTGGGTSSSSSSASASSSSPRSSAGSKKQRVVSP